MFVLDVGDELELVDLGAEAQILGKMMRDEPLSRRRLQQLLPQFVRIIQVARFQGFPQIASLDVGQRFLRLHDHQPGGKPILERELGARARAVQRNIEMIGERVIDAGRRV